jgi:hypothetical protein
MLKRIVIAAVLALFSSQVFAKGVAEEAFPKFKWIDANAYQADGSRFGYVASSFTVVGKPCHKLPKKDVCYVANNDLDFTLIGRYKSDSMKDPINILYSPGASMDPTFRITDAKNNVIWEHFVEELAIDGRGVIYTSGNINHMFNMRGKFKLADGKVTEVKQPFLYVGVLGKMLKPAKLYSAKTGGDVVASLPVGYEVEVLLAEDYQKFGNDVVQPRAFLVRTKFGLVGWLILSEADATHFDPIIKGLGYMGD